MKKIVIGVVILAIALGVAFWRFGYLLTQPKLENQPVTLNLWGLWEDENLIRPAFDAYKAMHPNVSIEYNHQNSLNYRTRIQTQISTENGPDIFMVHNTWLPMFLRNNSLSILPSSIYLVDDFKKDFYPVALDTLTKNNSIYALPLEIDGLALYYNEEHFQKAGITSPPKDWIEFENYAQRLTEKDSQGNITQSGAAMGATGNVDHWPDILGLLFLQQPGANLEKPANFSGADVLRFYTNFLVNPEKKTWSLSMESSTQAFYTGKLSMYFAPSWRASELRQFNKELKFKTAPVPQLPCDPGKNCKKVGWATFWAFAVSKNSPNQQVAWEFLKFLTSPDTEKLLYQAAAKERLVGQPYSRVSLQQELMNDPISGSFVSQGQIYKSWYLASKTLDQGLNDEMIKYYEDAVNAVSLKGENPSDALTVTEKGVVQVLEKYVLPPPSPTPK